MSKYFRDTITMALTTAQATSRTFACEGAEDISLEIQNQAGGGHAMNYFAVEVQDHPDGEFYTYLDPTSMADAENANVRAVSVSPGPDTTPDGSRTHLKFKAGAACAVRFVASLAAGAGSISVLVAANF